MIAEILKFRTSVKPGEMNKIELDFSDAWKHGKCSAFRIADFGFRIERFGYAISGFNRI
jgi:hypothetical protein